MSIDKLVLFEIKNNGSSVKINSSYFGLRYEDAIKIKPGDEVEYKGLETLSEKRDSPPWYKHLTIGAKYTIIKISEFR